MSQDKLLAAESAGEGSKGYIPKILLPKLPSKKLRHSEEVITERAQKLDKYLNDLVLIPEAMQNVHVLSFLGVMSTSRSEMPKSVPKVDEGSKPRQVIHLSALRRHLSAGDIVLFKCAHTVAGLQRSVTGAEWDHGTYANEESKAIHSTLFLCILNSSASLTFYLLCTTASIIPLETVGLVIQDVEERALNILESTGDGVTCYPLVSRILAYSTEFTSYMAIRKLQGPVTYEMKELLVQFVNRVNGCPYGFALKKLFPRKHRKSVTATGAAVSGGTSVEKAMKGKDDNIGEGEQQKAMLSSGQPPAPAGGDSEGEKDESSAKTDGHSFFCSELVAAGLQEMGVIRPDYNCSYFWPGSFAKKGEIDEALTEGLSYSDVVMLDTKLLEVGRAVINRLIPPRGIGAAPRKSAT